LRCHVAPVWLVAILPAITSSSWCVAAGATSARNNPSRGAGSSSATSSVAGPSSRAHRLGPTREPVVSDTLMTAATSAARDADYLKSFERHRTAWGELWQVCDLKVSGNERVQLLLRLSRGLQPWWVGATGITTAESE
jgi:hypothetical protein